MNGSNQITSITLKSKLPPTTLPNGSASFRTVIRIDVVPELDTSLKQAKARSVGRWFIREVFYRTTYEIRVESHCGIFEIVLDIDKDSWYVPFD
jgi:hypothetical protein